MSDDLRRDDELERLRRIVADYENTITWDTTCREHARLLDECRRQEERAEKAEREAEHRRLNYNAANAMAGVHKLRAERLKAELEHAKGALAGDSEAMAAFMADHAKVVARTREQCDMWQRAAEQAEAAIDRAHALAQRWAHEPHPTHDHLCPDELRRDLLTALDTPETGRD